MPWTSKEILSLVGLILYAILTPACVYTLYKHRVPSIIGHLFLFLFVILRIVADGLTISHRDDSPNSNATGAIINSIGLSPLLLATAGFIGETRYYILGYAQNERANKSGLVTEIALHALVIAGVALLATGNSKAATATSTSVISKSRAQEYAGAISLFIAWILICVWSFWTLRSSNRQKKEGRHHQLARLLLTEVMISLPFTSIRVCYSMVYTFDHSANLAPATSSFAVAFCLIFLPQLTAASIILLGLVVTRKIQLPNSEQEGVPRGDRSTITQATKPQF